MRDEVEVDGLRIAFERRGAGPPLLLLHGGVSDHREWRRQIDGLSDAFTVVAWDAPGCGDSADPPETFRMADYAECLASFIRAVGLDRPHILGLSWGSTLALELVGHHPRIARTLILASAYAGWAGSLPPREVAERLETSSRDMTTMSREAFARALVPTLLTERAPSELREEVVSIMAGSRLSGMRPMLLAMAEADLRGVLPAIAVPTLLLYGRDDVRSPHAVADEMHAAIPGSTLVLLSGGGHLSNLEVADAFNEEVRRFLRSR